MSEKSIVNGMEDAVPHEPANTDTVDAVGWNPLLDPAPPLPDLGALAGTRAKKRRKEGAFPKIDVDVEEIKRTISMLELVYDLRDAEEGEEDELLEALDDDAFVELAYSVADDPLFAQAPDFEAAGEEGLRSCDIWGSAREKPRYLYLPNTVKLRPVTPQQLMVWHLRGVNETLPLNTPGVHVMRPLAFSVDGDNLELVEGGLFEELVVLVQRGNLDIDVGGKVLEPAKKPAAKGHDPVYRCVALCAQDGKRLPSIRFSSKGGPASGLVVGHAPPSEKILPWRVENNRIVASSTVVVDGESEISARIVNREIWIPTGREAVAWARKQKLTFAEDPDEYAHGKAHGAHQLSPRDPWDDYPLNYIDVRILLAPAEPQDHHPRLARHEGDEEFLLMLFGALDCRFAQDNALRAEVLERRLDIIRKTDPGQVPNMLILGRSPAEGGRMEPSAVFFDSKTPHSFVAAGAEDAVCFQVVYSLNPRAASRNTRAMSVEASSKVVPMTKPVGNKAGG